MEDCGHPHEALGRGPGSFTSGPFSLRTHWSERGHRGTQLVSFSPSMRTASPWLESPQISLNLEWFLRFLGLEGQLPPGPDFLRVRAFSGSCPKSSFPPASAPLSSAPGVGEDGPFQYSLCAPLALSGGCASPQVPAPQPRGRPRHLLRGPRRPPTLFLFCSSSSAAKGSRVLHSCAAQPLCGDHENPRV